MAKQQKKVVTEKSSYFSGNHRWCAYSYYVTVSSENPG